MRFWQHAGKPDFAKCAEIISRFDPDLRESLSRSEGKVLQWCLFYLWKCSSSKGADVGYCSFSQGAVGEKVGRSRWTIARALVRLKRRGLIHFINRRPKNGEQWQTNLYFLGDKLKAILARLFSATRSSRPCSTFAPQEFRKNLIRPGDSLGGVAARQEQDIPQEKPTWTPTMSLSEMARRAIQGALIPKLAS